MRVNLSKEEYDELLSLEYVLTWGYSDGKPEKDEIRYSELQDINDNIGEYREYQINKLIAD